MIVNVTCPKCGHAWTPNAATRSRRRCPICLPRSDAEELQGWLDSGALAALPRPFVIGPGRALEHPERMARVALRELAAGEPVFAGARAVVAQLAAAVRAHITEGA